MSTRRLSIQGYLDQIKVIGQAIEECADQAGFDDSTNYACQLAVGEACENIILHGYGMEGAGEIKVVVHTQLGEITIELLDDAPPFDAAQKPETQTMNTDDPPIGGLGLRIIHRVMDHVEYHRRGNQNCLKLHKTNTEITT